MILKSAIAVVCLTALSTPIAAQSAPSIPSVYGDPINVDQARVAAGVVGIITATSLQPGWATLQRAVQHCHQHS